MSEDISGKISLPSFDDEEETLVLQWIRFKVHRLVKGFSQALTGAKEESFPKDADDALDLSTESGKKA